MRRACELIKVNHIKISYVFVQRRLFVSWGNPKTLGINHRFSSFLRFSHNFSQYTKTAVINIHIS